MALTCPQCGKALVPGALGNRCPRCLLDLALSHPDEADEAAPAPGSRRFGDYELLEEVGRGGMGVVYRARQISLQRIVAVKMLLARPFAVPELETRLHLEAEAAASLNHPHLVTIHEFGECDGQFYFSMEYVEGRSLAQLTQHHSLAPGQAARYVKSAAEAVHHAHEHGVLHRDLKPSNILIDLHDQVKVTDFGLAKRLGTDSELTLTGQLVGSPNYLSPEQAAGRLHTLTVRSDVYSLGAVLYQLLTTRPPLVGESLQETLAQIREKEVPSPRLLSPRVPRDLETICLKCLQKEPARRYDSTQALAADLGRFLEDQPIVARPVSSAERAWRWCRRKPALAGALAGCAFALLLGVGGIAWQWRRAGTEARVAQRNLYGADLLLAQQALEQSDLGRARALLRGHAPRSKAQPDLRAWEWRYLWARCQSDEASTLFRATDPVTALVLSGDGSQLAVHRYPGRLMLWDLPSQRLIGEHRASAWYRALAASPGGPLLAWASGEGEAPPSVVLWDSRSRQEVGRLPHGEEVVSLAFSPEARWLATLTCQSEVTVWDLGVRQVAARFQVQTNRPILRGSEYGSVQFSPTGQWLAVGTRQGRTNEDLLFFVDWPRGTVKGVPMPASATGVSALAFAPNGRWLGVGGGYFDNSIHLYDLETGQWGRLEGHRGWIAGLAFSPDGRVLASAGADQTLRLWSVPPGTELARFRGHEDEVHAVAWTPDGRRLLTGSKDGSVRLWDPAVTPPASTPRVLPGQIRDAVFTPDSQRLVTLSWTGKTAIFLDPHTLQEVGQLASTGSLSSQLEISADGRWLAWGDRTGTVEVWDLASRQQTTNLVVGAGYIQALQFSRRGDQLLCIGERTDSRRADTQRVLHFHPLGASARTDLRGIDLESLNGAVLSPDGRLLAVSHVGGTVAWWDLKTRSRQTVFQWPHLGAEVPIAFSPDGQWFAAGGPQSVLMLLEVRNRRSRMIPRAHLTQVNTVAFSPDGRRLVTSGTAGTDAVKVWDVQSGRDIATLSGRPGFYRRLGFSPDGTTLFAVAIDGTLQLWHAPSFEEIHARERAATRPP